MVSILTALLNLDGAEGDDRLFPVWMTTLKRSLTALWKATCLQDVQLHELRRTHATSRIAVKLFAGASQTRSGSFEGLRQAPSKPIQARWSVATHRLADGQ